MALGTQFWDKVVLDADFGSIVPPTAYGASLSYNEALPAHSKSIKFHRSLGSPISGSATSMLPGTIRPPHSSYTDIDTAYYTNRGIYAADTTPSILSGDFTIEAWVYISSTLSALPIVSFTTPGNGLGKACFYVQNMILRFHSALNTTDTLLNATIPSLSIWHKVAITRQGTTLKAYINNVLASTVTFTGSYIQPIPYVSIGSFPGAIGGSSSGYGAVADILVTRAAKTIFDPLNNTYLRYAAQIIGTITESLNITSWTITGISPTGLSCSTVTSSSSYTLNCPSLEPYTITCSPTVNGSWAATTTIQSGYFVVATNTDTNSNLYVCTTAGTTGGTEPTFISSTHTDGTVVWTLVGGLVNPISLGSRVPS